MSYWFRMVAVLWMKCRKVIARKLKQNSNNLKEEINMVDMYVALIIAGRRTIDTTPERYRAAVLVELNALGLDGYGNPLPVEPPVEEPKPIES